MHFRRPPSVSSPDSRRREKPGRRPTGLMICLGLFCLAAPPLTAQTDDSRWTLRGYGLGWLGVDDQVTVTRSADELRAEERTTHSVSDGSGFGLALEYRVTRKLGAELGVLFSDLDTDFRFESGATSLTDSDQIGVYTVTVGLSYHFAPGRRTDVFLGAFVGQSNFDDVIFLTEAGRRRTLAFDDDYGIGLKVGIDVPFRQGSHWGFTAEVRYLSTILESEAAGGDLDLDPLIPSIGISYRF